MTSNNNQQYIKKENFSYDPDARASYVYIGKRDTRKPYDHSKIIVKENGYTILEDQDKDGKIIGYEFLFSHYV